MVTSLLLSVLLVGAHLAHFASSSVPLLLLQPPAAPCPPEEQPPPAPPPLARYRQVDAPSEHLVYAADKLGFEQTLSLCMLHDGQWSRHDNFISRFVIEDYPADAIAATVGADDYLRGKDDHSLAATAGLMHQQFDEDEDDLQYIALSKENFEFLKDKINNVIDLETEKGARTDGDIPKDFSREESIHSSNDHEKPDDNESKNSLYYKYESSDNSLSFSIDLEFVPKKFKKSEENTWKGFSDSAPSHWVDLSHDIDVNYPDPNSGVILNVEGDNVDKNIFDTKNQPRVEFSYDDIDVAHNAPSSESGIETMGETMIGNDKSSKERVKREVTEQEDVTTPVAKTIVLPIPKIDFLRIEHTSKDMSTTDEGIPELLAGTSSVIRIFGSNLTEDTLITFTQEAKRMGAHCEFPATKEFRVEKGSVGEKTATVKIELPSGTSGSKFYICAKNSHGELDNETASDVTTFLHQGIDPWLQIETYDKLLPLWASLIIIGVCLFFSALFSGLNLGLMSLDRTELKILCNTGTEKEKEYARVIQPVRDHGNYLLCSILLGNVAVNSTFTILLDDLTSGVFAVIFSTVAIVLLGEITPQAICSRHGLAVGAKTIHITKAVMGLTFPLSFPVSKLLDVLLGEEIGNVYNRERLKELVKVTNDINDLDKDEVNIISGALELHKKTVSEVMTKIEDVFMLDYEAVLDFETVSEIMKSGFSRIPVFETSRTNIVAMLYIKDLVFVDPDDNTPLKTLCQFYQNPCNFLFEDVTLDVIFKQFKEGHKGHMAFVQRINSEGEGDPFYETIGLVTLEDVIEELIQSEIVDETDVFTDNRSKRRRNHPMHKLQDFGVFAERRENQRIKISPQLTLATFQYLSTSVDAFKPDLVSETILRRLLKQDIIHHIKYRGRERQKNDPLLIIYEQGKAVDYFVLILEGRVEVTVGREKLIFESGPFTYFGLQALTQNVGVDDGAAPSTLGSLQSINRDSMLSHTFVPDYTVRAVTEVFYVRIKRSLYLAAKRATLVQRCSGNRPKETDDSGEQFDDEVEKLLYSLDEEPSPVDTARSPSHNVSFRNVSPTGPNGSIKKSQHSSPVQTTTQAIPESTGESNAHESSALLPS